MNYRSVFEVAVSTILEGERDYDEQTLATPMFQILYVLRGVANIVLVNVKVQGVKRELLRERRKVINTYTRSLFAHNQKNSDSVFHCFVRQGSHSRNVGVWLRQNNDMQISMFLVMHKCVCGEHMKDMCQFSLFSSIANTLRPQWSERHLHFVHSKPPTFISIYDQI